MMIAKIMKLRRFKIILLFVLFLLVMTSVRLLWIYVQNPTSQPLVEDGILDLREVVLEDRQAIPLNGLWEFYPNRLLMPNAFDDMSMMEDKEYFSVPGKWDSSVNDEEGVFSYGTYRLRILLDDKTEVLHGIRLSDVHSAFRLFIDGQLVGGVGEVAEKSEDYVLKVKPFYTTFLPKTKEVELVLQIANESGYRKRGSIAKPITFGDAISIERQKWFAICIQVVVSAIFLLHLLYVSLLYLVGIRQRILATFSMVILFTVLSILMDNERVFLLFVPLNSDWTIKLIYFVYIGAVLSLIQFVRELFPNYLQSRMLKIFSWFSVVYMIALLVAPIEWVLFTKLIFNVLFSVSPMIVFILIAKVALKREEGAVFLLFAATAVASSMVWGSINARSDWQIGYYPFDMLASIIALSAYWFQRYFQSTILTTKLSEKLQRANDRKDDFLANTSHELRNPLHGIINIAQVVLEKEGDTLKAENKKNLQLLVAIGDHMSFVLNDLLDLTRLKENTIQLQLHSLPVQTVVRGVCDMLRFMVEGKPVQLVVEIDDAFPNVVADENRLVQILFNLIHNAIKYTHEGTISIRASIQKGQANITVEDTGTGMDQTIQERIFERYEQSDSSITALGGGLGLGLTICQELVTLHDGHLTISSTLGQGSAFTFTLPLSGEQGQVVQKEGAAVSVIGEDFVQSVEALELYLKEDDRVTAVSQELKTISLSRPRLLVVDDDPVNLQVLVHTLAAENYEVETALNGEEALEKLRNGKWDLLITDMMMPQMSGYELIRIVREKFTITDLPILCLTARSQREDILLAFRSGANDYVTKPVDAIELRARVQALIHLRQSIDERLRLEAAWLQAQINPHFFFNILNSIYILSEVDEEKMRELIGAFSEYLQTSFDFNNTEIVVPLDYELNLVRSYLAIEKIRFGDRIQIVWELDDNLHFSLPPLSMQTLAENAIKHGMLPRLEGGTITIQVFDRKDYYFIAICDDGVGFDKDELWAQLHGQGGVGIPNTNLRLKQLYGTGLDVESRLNEGTTVSFRVPKEQD